MSIPARPRKRRPTLTLSGTVIDRKICTATSGWPRPGERPEVAVPLVADRRVAAVVFVGDGVDEAAPGRRLRQAATDIASSYLDGTNALNSSAIARNACGLAIIPRCEAEMCRWRASVSRQLRQSTIVSCSE